MRKIYYLVFVLFCLSFVFSSCEYMKLGDNSDDKTEQPDDKTEQPKDSTDVIPDEPKVDAIKLVEVYESYYSKEFVDGVSNDYWMSFLGEGLELVDGEPMGSGILVTLEIFPTEVEGNFPIGEFVFAADAEDGYAWAGWEYDAGPDYGLDEGILIMPQGSFVYVVENGEPVEIKYIVSGKITISGASSAAEVLVDATFADGSQANYSYEGELMFEDYDELGGEGSGEGEYTYDWEPTVAEEFDVTFDYCQIFNNGNLYNTNSDYIELYLNGLEWYGEYDLFAPLNSGADAFGTYNIVVDKYDEWCGVPSSGGDDYGDTPSFFGTNFSEEGYYTTSYYVVSGTVVIAEDGVTVDVMTYYGSKIRATYEGEVVVETGEVQRVKAEQSVSAKQRRMKLVKSSVEDLIYFGTLRNYLRK